MQGPARFCVEASQGFAGKRCAVLVMQSWGAIIWCWALVTWGRAGMAGPHKRPWHHSVLVQRCSSRGFNTMRPWCIYGSDHPSPCSFQSGTLPSPMASSLGTKRPPRSPPSPTAKLYFQEFCSAGALRKLLSMPSHTAGAAKHPKPRHAGPKVLQSKEHSQKTTPRISSYPLRSEMSWHGLIHGERRGFLLQKDDLT